MRGSLPAAPTLECRSGPLGLPLCLNGSVGRLPKADRQLQELKFQPEHPRTATGERSHRRRPERQTRRGASAIFANEVSGGPTPPQPTRWCGLVPEHEYAYRFHLNMRRAQNTAGGPLISPIAGYGEVLIIKDCATSVRDCGMGSATLHLPPHRPREVPIRFRNR